MQTLRSIQNTWCLGLACSGIALALAAPTLAADVPAITGNLQPYTEQIPKTLAKFDMIPLPAGTIKVGGKDVAVKPCWISKTEVLWDEYDIFFARLDVPEKDRAAKALATSRPSLPYGAPDRGFGHQGYPAVSISFQAAKAYCTWLSNKTGKKYRLPTDAEFEYAARAGDTKDTLDKDTVNKVAWYWDNADDKTHPAMKKGPNAWGLYDMLGNAGEWTTAPDGSGLMMGGTYSDNADKIVYSNRTPYSKDWQVTDPQNPKSKWWYSDGPFNGLRVVREP